jgi:hypothetical protein
MNGPDHYAMGDRVFAELEARIDDPKTTNNDLLAVSTLALAHYTAALAAATAEARGLHWDQALT